MNLYWAQHRFDTYGYFVFAKTPGKARSCCTGVNTDDEEFTDFNPLLLRKNLDDEKYSAGVVEFVDKKYELVKDLGFTYREESA